MYIEGCGQLGGGAAVNWGDGFSTDRATIQSQGLSDPNGFFTTLLTKPYLGNVVISPHYYPPSISQNSASFVWPALWARMTGSFGYLTKAGYGGHRFPVVFGETGTCYTSANDIPMLEDMAKYINNEGAANDGLHNPMRNMIW
ncbi:hypothetical protein WJX81_000281 [Elliptochloris bilobata]|uniref:Glycoside hydrolase family 5 domain-containing protein n=1 Tax=Elliptochloris bilobata TaxID=381761 RepID=A0AAW1QM01_9CHLO